MKMERMTVTPGMARAWLQVNHNNRNLSRATVDAYARAMADGQWKLSPQPVVLNGATLLDGQHRLNAVIKAGIGVEFWVCSEADKEVQSVVDRGKPRSQADVLQMHHGIKNAKRALALARTMEILDEPGSGDHRRRCMMDYEAHESVSKYATEISWALSKPPTKGLASASFLGVLAWMLPVHSELIDAFHDAVSSGAGLNVNSAELRLRDRLLHSSGDLGGSGRATVMMMTITALRRSLDGLVTKRLEINPSDHERLWRQKFSGVKYEQAQWMTNRGRK